jgi:protein SCO1/2
LLKAAVPSIKYCIWLVVPLFAMVFSTHTVGLRAQEHAPLLSQQSLPDVELTDQHGRKVHFYSDLVKGRVVAVNTVFTTCTTICPTMGVTFQQLSRIFANQSPTKLSLISISVDPVVDTPQKLDEWSRMFGKLGPDWILLTGSKENIDTLLSALQLYTSDKQLHKPTILIGGEGGRDWARTSALLPPTRLAELIHARLDEASGPGMPRP